MSFMKHVYLPQDGVEICYSIQTTALLNKVELKRLMTLLSPGFMTKLSSVQSGMTDCVPLEIGPRLSFETPFSTNLVAICRRCGLDKVVRIERSRRYRLPEGVDQAVFVAAHSDLKMETVYDTPIKTFDVEHTPQPAMIVPLMEQGIAGFDVVPEVFPFCLC